MLITGAVQKQAWMDRTMPPVEHVRGDIWSIPVDFSQAPVRYTFAYLVMNGAGQSLLIDPGFDSARGRSQIAIGLERAGMTIESIVGIVSTHLHPDHLGMAEHIAGQSGAWIGMHPRESALLALYDDEASVTEVDQRWLEEIGVPPERMGELLTPPATIRYMQGLARTTLPLEDGDFLPLPGRSLRVVATPGHTPGHVCIVDEDNEIVFSGDHILPRITSNVGLTSTGTRRGALAQYYSSLDRMKQWPDFEVLPAHEYRFSGLAHRADDLARHHRERAQEIVNAVGSSEGYSVYSIAQRISWSRSWESLHDVNLRAALSETEAHVDFLIDAGKLEIGGGEVMRLVRRHAAV